MLNILASDSGIGHGIGCEVGLSDRPIDGIWSVLTMDVIVGGELKFWVTQCAPGTRNRVLRVLP